MFCLLMFLISDSLCLSTSGESISGVCRARGCHPSLPTETGPDSRGRRGRCATTWGKHTHTQPGHSSANSLHKGKYFLQPQDR